MLISGFKKRSISDQTGVVEFLFNVNPLNTTGNTFVGLSGTQTFGFNFHNSRIYDPKGNFVSSYEANTSTIISGQVGPSSYDYYINDQIIALGNAYQTGKFSWIYVDTDSSINFEGGIKGRIPNYSLDTTGKYEYQNFLVTGKIINQDENLAFRIFDVEIAQQTSPFSISGFTTGDITNTGFIYLTSNEIGLADSTIPLLINTNFGDINVNFIVSGDYTLVPDVFLNISPNSTNVISNTPKHYNVQISNFPSGTQIGVYLSYENGITGNIYAFEQKVSDLTGIATTGLISGAGILSSFQYGSVSGLDPKTNIWETGSASGSLQTDLIFATGRISYNYSITGYGGGEGYLNINFPVSGITTGFFEGDVFLDGGFVNAITYDFLGTGNFPGFGTGASLNDPLVYLTDYYSGVVETNKAFTGLLTLPYSVLSIGWATGQTFSGNVQTNFAKLFDLGTYTFRKFYSGLVTGTVVNTGDFNPNVCISEQPISTGIITGNFALNLLLDCTAVTGALTIPVSGIPSQIFGSNNQLLGPNTVVEIHPSGGYGDFETSYYSLSGVFTRTKTSRMGVTPSGSGLFQHIVGSCLDLNVNAPILSNPTDVDFNVWKETINTVVTSGQFDSNNNYLASSDFNMYITGSGGDYGNPQDSGLLHFVISGEGKKSIALKGIFPSFVSVSSATVEFFLYKNGSPTEIWETQGNNFGGSVEDYLPSSPWQKWNVIINQDLQASDTVVVLEDLTSGYYSLYAYVQPKTPPIVYFTKPIFSGCESSQNLVFEIAVSGDMVSDTWVEIKDYEERTAHSGVNYDPLFFVYSPDSLHITGERRNAHAGGLYFSAAAQDYSSGYGFQSQRLTIPIYDNAAFGLDHELYIILSNPSGATLPFSYRDDNGVPYLLNTGDPYCFKETLIRIIENDNGTIPTGIYQQAMPVTPSTVSSFPNGAGVGIIIPTDGNGDWFYDSVNVNSDVEKIDAFDSAGTQFGVVITSGLLTTSPINDPFFCDFIPPIIPPEPPACWPDCSRKIPVEPPTDCKTDCPNPEPDCCTCDNLVPSGISCGGYGLFPVDILPSGAKCGQGSVSDECGTDCYIFAGSLCMSRGTSFIDSFSTVHDTMDRTDCTYDVKVFDPTCLRISDGGIAKCPEDGGCPFDSDNIPNPDPESPDSLTSICNEDGELIGFQFQDKVIYANCPNLAEKFNGKTKPPANGCSKKLVFLKVVCPVDSDEEGQAISICYPNDEGGGNVDCPAGDPCTTEDDLPGRSCGGVGFLCRHSWTYNFWSAARKPQIPTCPPPS